MNESQPVILVVDDEYAIVALLADTLTDAGYTVITARHGREALESLTQSRADLVLSDVMMPVMSGIALYEALRESLDYRRLPVILMSAAPLAHKLPAERTHLTTVTKPFDLDSLLATIDRTLREESGTILQ
jgi:CheY-like chemotaxis protein